MVGQRKFQIDNKRKKQKKTVIEFYILISVLNIDQFRQIKVRFNSSKVIGINIIIDNYLNKIFMNTTYETTRNIKYKISAEIHKLKIKKDKNFQTKVIWKRHNNKTQTKLVNHVQGISTFPDPISLEITLQYDTVKNCYLEKNVEFLPAVSIQGSMKSGGSAKIDIAEGLNKNLTKMRKTIPLLKCPDPQGYLQITFEYEQLEDDAFQTSNTSILLNNSQLTLNTSTQLSQIQFKSQIHKISQLKNLNNTIAMFEQLNNKIKNKNKKSENLNSDNSSKKTEQLQNQNNQLKLNIKKLEQKIQYNEITWKNQKKQFEKKINNLEKLIDAKNQESFSKSRQIQNLSKTLDSMSKIQNNSKNYEQLYTSLKQKYEEKQQEFEMLQSKLKSTESKIKQNSNRENSGELNFSEKNPFDNHDFGKQFGFSRISEQKFEELEKEKIQLQTQLALTCHKIGTLFNAAYEIGGARLLDKLQSSIGLIQLN